MNTLKRKYLDQTAIAAQAELRNIAQHPINKRTDAESRSCMLGIMCSALVESDRLARQRGMVASAADAF